MPKIEELRDAVATLKAEITELSELEDITDEQDARLDEAIVESEARVAELDAAETRAAKVQAVKDRTDVTTVSGDGLVIVQPVDAWDGRDLSRATRGEVRDMALKVLDTDDADLLNDDQKRHLSQMLRSQNGNQDGGHIARRLVLTENPAYRSAFVKLVTRPHPTLNADEARAVEAFDEFRAMSIGTDSAGGYGLPVLIDPTIILTSQGSSNAVFEISRKITITTDEWKGVTTAGVSWSWDGEAVQVSDDSPTLAQPNIPVHKAQGFIPYSIEVGQDYPGFATEMSRLLVEGWNELQAQAFVVGTGTLQPTGIAVALNATASEVIATTDGAYGSVDVYALWDALPERFRMNATWLSSVDVMNHTRQFAAGSSNSDANFTVNIMQDAVPRLFGQPYRVSEYMADFTGTTGQSDYLIVGDFSHYLIVQRAGMTVELVPHLFSTNAGRPTGQRGWYAWARVGANVTTANAFRMLTNT